MSVLFQYAYIEAPDPESARKKAMHNNPGWSVAAVNNAATPGHYQVLLRRG